MDPPDRLPECGTALVRIELVALNHLDLYRRRGMAFAKGRLPMTVGVEAAGVVEALGPDTAGPPPGTRVVIYPGLVCRRCGACAEGRENLCEDPGGILGFHADGLAVERATVRADLLIPVPDSVPLEYAVCTPITMATVQHMLFDNARLKASDTILVHAGGSGVGSTAIGMAKAEGAVVFTTVGSDEKARKATALGADYVINYRTHRFEREIRRLTGGRGIDVVFEHVGAQTWEGSLLSLALGGRLVICGSTSGVSANTNLLLLFNRQIRIFASFGGTMLNVQQSLEKLSTLRFSPELAAELPMEDFAKGLELLERREVFGKLLCRMSRPPCR